MLLHTVQKTRRTDAQLSRSSVSTPTQQLTSGHHQPASHPSPTHHSAIMTSRDSLALLLVLFTAVAALQTPNHKLNRRSLLQTATAFLVVAPSVAVAADASVLLGTYTDPVNHPGGTRTIELTGTGFGGFQLAKVTGGGGKGEPESYELNAMISPCPGRSTTAEWCISIDFTPKGGPADFGGYWDAEEKGIRFPADGNFWPKKS